MVSVETEIDMVESGVAVVDKHRRHDFLHVRDLSSCAHDNGARAHNLLSVGVLLAHGQRVLAGRHVDLQCAAEVGESFHAGVETGVFSLLRTARPHPVGAERHTVKPFGKGCPYHVGERLSHRQHTSCCGVGEAGLWSVSDSGGNTFLASEVERHHSAVGQWQL